MEKVLQAKNYLYQNTPLMVALAVFFTMSFCILCLFSLAIVGMFRTTTTTVSLYDLEQVTQQAQEWRETVASDSFYSIYFVDLSRNRQLELIAEFDQMLSVVESGMARIEDRSLDNSAKYEIREFFDILDFHSRYQTHLCEYRSPREVIVSHGEFDSLDSDIKQELIIQGERLCSAYDRYERLF